MNNPQQSVSPEARARQETGELEAARSDQVERAVKSGRDSLLQDYPAIARLEAEKEESLRPDPAHSFRPPAHEGEPIEPARIEVPKPVETTQRLRPVGGEEIIDRQRRLDNLRGDIKDIYDVAA